MYQTELFAVGGPPVTFDAVKAMASRDAGMARAAAHHHDLLEIAQSIAIELSGANGTLTADDVYEALIAKGYSPSALGNAAGSIFRVKGWHFTGEWRTSTRVSNRARQNRVWVWTPQDAHPTLRIAPGEAGRVTDRETSTEIT